MVAIEHPHDDSGPDLFISSGIGAGGYGSAALTCSGDPAEAVVESPEPGSSPPTVLIVDDDPRNLFALESVLRAGILRLPRLRVEAKPC